jgi:hypothetical protein
LKPFLVKHFSILLYETHCKAILSINGVKKEPIPPPPRPKGLEGKGNPGENII